MSPIVNDIQGFPNPKIYPELAESPARLIVMHSVQEWGRATRMNVAPDEILRRVLPSLNARIARSPSAGVARERLILDPGMGFFFGSNPDASLTILRNCPG